MLGLCAEAAKMAIEDAGLLKEDIDGLITAGGTDYPASFTEHLGIHTTFATGVSMMGASGATATTIAAMAVIAGMAKYVLVVMGAEREPGAPFGGPQPPGVRSEWEEPYGMAVAANTYYGAIMQRHMYEFGTTPEQFAKISVDERTNAVPNPNAVFNGQPITLDDVLNSRYINRPLHMLECVMPCGGAAALIVTTAELAKSRPNRTVYILGSGIGQHNMQPWTEDRMVVTGTRLSAKGAFEMAGYTPNDVEFAEFYD
jgi:acetyl-CoA acetyltransferase